MTKVAIIGAGKGGRALLEMFAGDPTVTILGVIDVTGSPEVQRAILELKRAATEVMGGASARFMWDLLAERKRSEELEDRYSLMLREMQAQAEGDFIIGQNPKMKEVAQLGAALHSRHGRASQGLGRLQRGQRPLSHAALTGGGRARPG